MTTRRQTTQKAAILRAFENDDRPLSPQEVLDAARAEVPALGIATVYRTIKSFLEDGVVTAVGLPDSPPRYELSGKAHHHHFQCRYCDKVYEIFACSGGIKGLTPDGFTMEDHEIMLFGKCAECRAAA
jgi:Fur family ferric uptake transcriptional regulator